MGNLVCNKCTPSDGVEKFNQPEYHLYESIDLSQGKTQFLVFSPFFKPLGLMMTTVSYLLIAILIAILVEWIGMHFWWDSTHAQSVLMAELEHLGDNFTTSFTGHHPADLALLVATQTKAMLTENAVAVYFSQLAVEQPNSYFFAVVGSTINAFSVYIESALFVTMIISVRLTIIILSMLILVLVSLVSVVDGLVERELRNYGGDIEHSRIVHLGLYWSPKLAVAAPVLYLAWPGVANPVFFFVPAMCLFGVTNYIIFSKYQKRL